MQKKNQLRISLFAPALLALLLAGPVLADDDELEITMEVMDSFDDLDGNELTLIEIEEDEPEIRSGFLRGLFGDDDNEGREEEVREFEERELEALRDDDSPDMRDEEIFHDDDHDIADDIDDDDIRDDHEEGDETIDEDREIIDEASEEVDENVVEEVDENVVEEELVEDELVD